MTDSRTDHSDVNTSPAPNVGVRTNTSTTVMSMPLPNYKPSSVRPLPSIKRPASPPGYTNKVARENPFDDQTHVRESRSRNKTRAPPQSQTPQPDSDISNSSIGGKNSLAVRSNSTSYRNSSSSRLLEARPRTQEISSRSSKSRPELDGVVMKRKMDKKRSAKSAVNTPPLSVRREAVVHVVYAGRPDHLGDHVYDADEQGRASPRRRFMLDTRASTAMSRMTTPTADQFAVHCEYPVMEEDDCSLTRSLSRSSVLQADGSGNRSPFLYQMIDFDNFTENVPSFVRQDVKRNGRLVTEIFILKVNFLRRRRQLGETSTTMNPNAKKAQQLSMLSGAGGQGAADKVNHQNSTAITADGFQ
ncbi:unnamed protein product [Lymnaea stagnalis]|uniref:Uncharacterized protein n=1 Tax=Lymnaea stagnalis TaxID=6523 RepID=A0AAV2IBU9_LYMST